jgi:hypothetical protein
MKNKFILIVITLFTLQITYAQDNYTKGYVIDNQQDTIHGLINYGNWEHNPFRIEFKNHENNVSTVFTPTDIKEFRVSDEIYVSGFVEAENTPLVTHKLEENPSLKISNDTIFLQTLIRGEKSLFYYNNRDDRANFYIEANGEYKLLVHKRYLTKVRGKEYRTKNEKYLGQLSDYLKDCQSISSQIENSTYQRKTLMKLFQYYYKCAPKKKDFEKKIGKIRTEFGAIGGLSMSSVNFSSTRFLYLINGDYGPSINPTLGLYLDVIIPRNSGRLSIHNELLLTSLNATHQYDTFENEDIYTKNDIEIGFTYLKMNNLIRYKYFLKDQLALYLNAGMANGLMIAEKNSNKVASKFYSTERMYEEPAIDKIRKYEEGWILGTGIKLNKITGEIRYERGSGMSGIQILSSTVHRFYFLFGYQF